jgi:hypothetical protein
MGKSVFLVILLVGALFLFFTHSKAQNSGFSPKDELRVNSNYDLLENEGKARSFFVKAVTFCQKTIILIATNWRGLAGQLEEFVKTFVWPKTKEITIFFKEQFFLRKSIAREEFEKEMLELKEDIFRLAKIVF